MGNDSYKQANRPLTVKTALPGTDPLLLVGFSGQEGISQLFEFRLQLIAKNGTDVAFDKLLGQPVTVYLTLADNKTKRFFNGICYRVSQGDSDREFTSYEIDIVPAVWPLTRRAQSRIFQNATIVDILKKVFEKLPVDFSKLTTANYKPRVYCVQYRETDFNFASRLMEEEGIYYYFKHADGSHQMVLADKPAGHEALSGQIIYEKGSSKGHNKEDRIYDWDKFQEVRSGKYTLWDFTFFKPHSHLNADQSINPDLQVGQVKHKLKVGVLNFGDNEALEIYDYPGGYANRFDGVDASGGKKLSEIDQIFQDNTRTVKLREEEEGGQSLLIHGAGNCRQLVSGYKFTLKTLATDDRAMQQKADGTYVFTTITHNAQFRGAYRSGDWGGFTYFNSFTCIPLDEKFPFRPVRKTPKPVIPGTHTALVVGSGAKDEEYFVDPYGRVKVQFHWDRKGPQNLKKDDQGVYKNSSCWIRVGQVWAGKRWGAYFWPRIGQEVIVAFLEGDPDQPLIVGSVYNDEQQPPYLGDSLDSKHKNDPKVSGIKTNTTPGGEGFNELRFDDNKGKEQIFMHAQHNMDVRVRNDNMERVIGNRHLIVGWEKDGKKGGDQKEKVYQDKHLKVERHQVEVIGGDMQLLIGGGDQGKGNLDVSIKGDRKATIGGEDHLHVTKDRKEKIDGGQSLTVAKDQQEKVTGKHALDAGDIHLKAGKTLILEAGTQISIKVGGNFVDIAAAGVTIVGTMVKINSGGAAGSGGGSSPTAPTDAQEAKPAKPAHADDSKSGSKSVPSSWES